MKLCGRQANLWPLFRQQRIIAQDKMFPSGHTEAKAKAAMLMPYFAGVSTTRFFRATVPAFKKAFD